MSAHTASWHRPTGRHAARNGVLVRRWVRHALRVVLRLADQDVLLAATAVPDLSVSLAHRRRAAWTRWTSRTTTERQEQHHG